MPVCTSETLPLEPVLFEALCRAAATRMEVPSFCRLRRCRRRAFCEGKLAPRAIPPCFRGLKDVEVLLPACMAGADDLWFGEFLLKWILCHEDYFGLVRPPQAVRSPLCLDEYWPVFDHVAADTCASIRGNTILTRFEKTMAGHDDKITEIASAHDASRSEIKGD